MELLYSLRNGLKKTVFMLYCENKSTIILYVAWWLRMWDFSGQMPQGEQIHTRPGDSGMAWCEKMSLNYQISSLWNFTLEISREWGSH